MKANYRDNAQIVVKKKVVIRQGRTFEYGEDAFTL
jgi:hypothetical protein